MCCCRSTRLVTPRNPLSALKRFPTLFCAKKPSRPRVIDSEISRRYCDYYTWAIGIRSKHAAAVLPRSIDIRACSGPPASRGSQAARSAPKRILLSGTSAFDDRQCSISTEPGGRDEVKWTFWMRSGTVTHDQIWEQEQRLDTAFAAPDPDSAIFQ